MHRRDSSGDHWGTSRQRSTINGRRAAMRVLNDRLNGMVIVYERDAVIGEKGPRTLIFETHTSVMPLEEFPPEWRRMSEEALLALRYPHS